MSKNDNEPFNLLWYIYITVSAFFGAVNIKRGVFGNKQINELKVIIKKQSERIEQLENELNRCAKRNQGQVE